MKTMKKWIGILLCAALLAGLLSACGKSGEEQDNNYIELDDTVSGETLTSGKAADDVFSLSVDFNKPLNPITTTSALNQMVGDLVYDRLFEVDGNFNVTSRILSDWYYSKNEGSAGVWVLTLRPDIMMHDGEPMTANDVVYSLSRVFTSGSAHYQQQMSRIYVSGYQGQIYIAGDYDNGLLIQRLSVPIIRGGTDAILANIPVGSGPYRYSEDGTTLEKFEDYEFADDLPVDTIHLRQYIGPEELITEFESALVDVVVNDPTNIYNMGYGGKNEKRTLFTGNMHFICFNSNSTFFRYDAYRTAMNYIIDREAIAEDVLDGAADGAAIPIHPNSSLYDQTFAAQYDYNPEKCISELGKGGCRDLDGDGNLEFALSGNKVDIVLNFVVCADNAAKVQAARKIAEDLRAIGLPVNLRELTWKEYIAALRYDPEDEDIKEEDRPSWTWDMYYGEIGLTGDWNTLTLFTGDWFEDGTLNYGRWSMDALDTAVHSYLGAVEEERKGAETAMLQTLVSSSPFVTVCFERKEVISHVGVITGMEPNQYNIFHGISNWNIHLD